MLFFRQIDGHLVQKAEDHPLSKRFSHLSGQTDYEEYAEDIYVGYRYCDAFGQEPLYPFGYGLSYTSFAIKGRMEVEKTTVSLEVEVDNVGKRMGAEVVEAYVGFPDGRLPREKKALVGFARTGELESWQSETVAISFDLTDFAYYDEAEAAYFLDEGNYPVYVSDNGRDLIPVGQLILEGRAKTEQAVNIAPLKDGFPEIEAPRSKSAPSPPKDSASMQKTSRPLPTNTVSRPQSRVRRPGWTSGNSRPSSMATRPMTTRRSPMSPRVRRQEQSLPLVEVWPSGPRDGRWPGRPSAGSFLSR